MITRTLLAAIVAGLLAGSVMSVVQYFKVIPLIIAAEAYENSASGGHRHDAAEPAGHGHDAAESDASGEDAAWAPADGMERTLHTLMANLLVGVTFALLLTAGIVFSGREISPYSGLMWGGAGFAVFVAAPILGLPPELPGMPAADLFSRQSWWLATAALTASGLALIAFPRLTALRVLGVLLIVAPHVYGAPVPGTHESAVPAGMVAQYVAASVATLAIFWAVLGGLLGTLLSRRTGDNTVSA
ncbi:MAG: CbtA family protein [Fimbriimonadaceae bacterium]|nr:CbtA family protein [Alphaproteobacteria bacterium]